MLIVLDLTKREREKKLTFIIQIYTQILAQAFLTVNDILMSILDKFALVV